MTHPPKPTAIGDDALDAVSGGWASPQAGPGQDTANLTAEDGHQHGPQNNPALVGMASNDTLIGDGGNDIMWGMAGDDLLVAGGGLNFVHGGDGDDILDANGSDGSTLHGDDGTDTVVLDTGGADLMEFRHAVFEQLFQAGIGCRLLEDGSIRLNFPAGFEGPLTLPGNIVAYDIERIAFR